MAYGARTPAQSQGRQLLGLRLHARLKKRTKTDSRFLTGCSRPSPRLSNRLGNSSERPVSSLVEPKMPPSRLHYESSQSPLEGSVVSPFLSLFFMSVFLWVRIVLLKLALTGNLWTGGFSGFCSCEWRIKYKESKRKMP
ncbi:hypothetical protein H112_06460 [Trichophyton rubrum D6]|uniref:Uncharacterized protein n=2 Tax=Trichophyton rubrum TaxID=5551 RepID=A0A080WHE7_TRIRC|nr:uncharacterized protein TERG_11763 [Trichophyton rubrum CBS 118892]EZF13044.1 hypothetical protein H100_06475 [Trichophyton rubrum MR850]EZF39434.1 hypothetical protein H102_06441 [Trichophyton rubrum CBS 100081]EZF50030.1 hypothetical protein H103_06468 [Trichophyton rubrum CBS 288.86]EZF60664.1 hypothetical protein H104_06452 [Trichophyton rubrum CBS 289.86]EZF82012.1 hypothetical protein H110_06463 [Trichophyton rubrum MR1448]EZF92679.1 hypothetical protein H113_06513 [Trichophyton rubr